MKNSEIMVGAEYAYTHTGAVLPRNGLWLPTASKVTVAQEDVLYAMSSRYGGRTEWVTPNRLTETERVRARTTRAFMVVWKNIDGSTHSNVTLAKYLLMPWAEYVEKRDREENERISKQQKKDRSYERNREFCERLAKLDLSKPGSTPVTSPMNRHDYYNIGFSLIHQDDLDKLIAKAEQGERAVAEVSHPLDSELTGAGRGH